MEPQAWMETLLASAPLGIGFKNVHGYLEYANSALCDLLGYEREELCGTTLATLIDGDAVAYPHFERGGDGSGIRPRSMIWFHKNGTRISTVTLFGATLDDESRYAGSSMVVLTEQVAAQVFSASGYGDVLRRIDSVLREGQHLLSALDRMPLQRGEPGVVRERVAWPTSPAWMGRLSVRERDVTQGVLEGMPLKAIAERHGITTHTVRNHLKSVFRKLHVHSQQQLVARYLRDSLPPPLSENGGVAKDAS